jgi:putative ATP-dependent endonuclease of OLD family
MYVSRLKIEGFRGANSADLQLSPHSVLIGINNSGKTTIIEALALLLGRDRLVRRLTEHDFYSSNPTEASRIKIIATVTDFPHNDTAHNQPWFGMEAGVDKWLDSATGALHTTPDDPAWKLAVQIGFAAPFYLEELEAETVRFFVDDEASLGDPFAEDAYLRMLLRSTCCEIPIERTLVF